MSASGPSSLCHFKQQRHVGCPELEYQPHRVLNKPGKKELFRLTFSSQRTAPFTHLLCEATAKRLILFLSPTCPEVSSTVLSRKLTSHSSSSFTFQGNKRRKIVTSMMCYLARDHRPTLIGQLPFPKQIILILEAKFQPRSQIFKSFH